MDDSLPTKEELLRRQKFYERSAELRLIEPLGPGPSPNIKEMIREDRDR
jgi:hypothetical protein